ncbi:MAG: hypothetical protein LUD68_00915 [Rikenellaceae bacterium]|nr:hypothetical protein [Rikenellaceae bacterium]
MDVFLGPLEGMNSVRELDSLARYPGTTLLFIRRKEVRQDPELQEWINRRQPGWSTEDYAWYELGTGW